MLKTQKKLNIMFNSNSKIYPQNFPKFPNSKNNANKKYPSKKVLKLLTHKRRRKLNKKIVRRIKYQRIQQNN